MNATGVRVLVVDDESSIRRFLNAALSAHGYTVLEADSGQAALASAAADQPDLVILDLGLPDFDGVEVTRRLREWSRIPIIVVSVRDREADKIAALDAGADDYVTKPFGIGELVARMSVALRHSSLPPVAEAVITIDQLAVDVAKREVRVGVNEVQLTPTEFDLLRILASHAGQVLTHGQLLRQVWGRGYEQEMHVLRVNISNLRRKIESDPARPHYIHTEPGVGYRLYDSSG